MKQDCICAISTPVGIGGISIVRMSGINSAKIACSVCQKDDFIKSPRKMILTKVKTQEFDEYALVVYFNAPNSYTGEDMIEIQCHGGIVIANGILKELILNGARLAENGEFTKRAFINGKMSLDEAEGVIDMINSESQAEVRAGFNLLSGKLKQKIKDIQNILTDCFARIEVALDYPEHDIEYSTSTEIKKDICTCIDKIDEMLSSVYAGRIVKYGINVAIVGKPNVGKSSLLNAFVGKDRAIVTSVAGTTRDILEENITIGGVKVNFVDTAGIRESKDEVEKIGVERAKEKALNCDIVLAVFDLNDFSFEHLEMLKNKKLIVVINKIDAFNEKEVENYKSKLIELLKSNDFSICEVLCVSALNLTNIEKLKQTIYDLVVENKIITNSTIITNARHEQLLLNAKNYLKNSLETIDSEKGLELVNIDLTDAWDSIGQITGDTNTEERIDAIFSKFCLGK